MNLNLKLIERERERQSKRDKQERQSVVFVSSIYDTQVDGARKERVRNERTNKQTKIIGTEVNQKTRE